jgi:hypothetical protein
MHKEYRERKGGECIKKQSTGGGTEKKAERTKTRKLTEK